MIRSDFECRICGHRFEKDINAMTAIDLMECPKCGKMECWRIITFRGGLRADPTWLDSACEVLQPDGERPIESRSEFDKYLKKHDIVQRC